MSFCLISPAPNLIKTILQFLVIEAIINELGGRPEKFFL
ncbi:MAG: hypothetical protein ACI8P3_001103 [Saprospiraceae bacterium]|jgi:hypothetical protein